MIVDGWKVVRKDTLIDPVDHSKRERYISAFTASYGEEYKIGEWTRPAKLILSLLLGFVDKLCAEKFLLGVCGGFDGTWELFPAKLENPVPLDSITYPHAPQCYAELWLRYRGGTAKEWVMSQEPPVGTVGCTAIMLGEKDYDSFNLV